MVRTIKISMKTYETNFIRRKIDSNTGELVEVNINRYYKIISLKGKTYKATQKMLENYIISENVIAREIDEQGYKYFIHKFQCVS